MLHYRILGTSNQPTSCSMPTVSSVNPHSVIHVYTYTITGHIYLSDFNVATYVTANKPITSMTGTKPYMGKLLDTVRRKYLAGEKLVNLANCANIHRYTETVFGICTNCCLFAKFFLANSFYLYGSPKFSPTKYFPYTVVHRVVLLLLLYLQRPRCILPRQRGTRSVWTGGV